jgi:hypothetical protein
VAPVDFDQFPFQIRPDLTPYLIHLTKNIDASSALDNLVSILETGRINGTTRYVKGPRRAACFMDVPFTALKYICSKQNEYRYQPYGVIVRKTFAYERGARPVLYLSKKETATLEISSDDQWRVVRFEGSHLEGWVGWLHEREWRCPDLFRLPKTIIGVLVKSSDEALRLTAKIHKQRGRFACIPRSIIPLQVVCQGLDRK